MEGSQKEREVVDSDERKNHASRKIRKKKKEERSIRRKEMVEEGNDK